MQPNTTPGRLLAIASGMAFSAGSLVILMGDVLTRPQTWEQYHVLTILTVGGTIAAGHLMAKARSARHWAGAFGFGVLFLSGTLLVVYNSVGRQAASSEAVTLTTETRNKAISDKAADLDRARSRLADAERMVDIETKNRFCGRSCNDWKRRAVEVRAHVQVLEGELSALGAPVPVQPKAAKMAAVMALFGADEVQSKAALMLLEPLLWTLFFEIGTIVSLGYAFRTVPDYSTPVPRETAALLPPVDAAEEGPDNVTDWCHHFKARHGRQPSIPEVQAAFPTVPKTTAWRRARAA